MKATDLKLFEFLFLLFWLVSCSEEPKKVHNYGALSHLKQDSSEVSLPLLIPMDELERLANQALTAPLLTRSDLPANYEMVVEKDGDLTMEGYGEGIEWQIPVRLQLSQSNNQSDILYFSLKLTVRSRINLAEEFNLITTSKVTALQWIKRPEIDMGFMALDLSGVVEKKIWEQREDIQQRIDKSLSSKVHLRPVVERVWEKMHRPIQLSRKVDHTTMYVEGYSLSYAQPQFRERVIIVPTQLKCGAMAYWGEDTLSVGFPPLPRPAVLEKVKEQFSINLLTVARFNQIEKTLMKEIGREPYEYEDISLSVKQLEIGGFDKSLCLTLDLKGDYELKAEVCAQIKVDSATQQIGLSSPKIEVLDGDASVSMAIEVLEGYILDIIEKEVQMDLTGVFNSIPEMIYRGVERGKSGDKVNVMIEEMNVSILDYVVHKDEIEIQLHAGGKAMIDIEKLKKN